MAKRETKSTSKWVLGGDGISNVKVPDKNKEAVRRINAERRSSAKSNRTKK